MKKHKKHKKHKRSTSHFVVTIPLNTLPLSRIHTEGVNPYSILQAIEVQSQEEVDPLDPKSITPFDVYLYRTFVQKEKETEHE